MPVGGRVAGKVGIYSSSSSGENEKESFIPKIFPYAKVGAAPSQVRLGCLSNILAGAGIRAAQKKTKQ